MRFHIRFCAFAIACTAAFGSARFSGEKGVAAHRARLAAGGNHTCAILDDGTVHCWGENHAGQVGDGSIVDRHSPVAVIGTTSAVSISAGRQHSCALTVSGSVICWGDLPNGNSFPTGSPVPMVVPNLTDVIAIASGFSHACVLRRTSTVWCWGANELGQLGNGTIGGTQINPVQVLGLTEVVSIAAGGSHTCAIMVDGTVQCWGEGTSGQLGNGRFSTLSRPAPTAGFTPSAAGAVDLSLGATFSCALLSNSTVFCWGDNSNGELGIGNRPPSAIPVKVGFDNANVVALGAGNHHACAILADGTVSCCGGFTATVTLLPAEIDLPAPPSVEIAGGAAHACASKANGNIVMLWR